MATPAEFSRIPASDEVLVLYITAILTSPLADTGSGHSTTATTNSTWLMKWECIICVVQAGWWTGIVRPLADGVCRLASCHHCVCDCSSVRALPHYHITLQYGHKRRRSPSTSGASFGTLYPRTGVGLIASLYIYINQMGHGGCYECRSP